MNRDYVGIQEQREGSLAKMTTYIENSKYIERCEFELINETWIQVDRKRANK